MTKQLRSKRKLAVIETVLENLVGGEQEPGIDKPNGASLYNFAKAVSSGKRGCG
jgi:hypothetical protein